MISLDLQGALNAAEKIKLLALTPQEKRRAHAWLARDLLRAMKRAVKATVERSDPELFEGSARMRRRKAASFARMLRSRGTVTEALLIDSDLWRRGHGEGRKSKNGLATAEQAARAKELGIQMPRTKFRALPMGVAGKIIRQREEKQGLGKYRKRQRRGSLIQMVWREEGETIIAEVNPAQVFKRFLQARAA